MTRMEKLEIENKRLRDALTTISQGIEIVTCQPRMNGTFEQHPRLVSWNRLQEIAMEALEVVE